MISNNDNLKIIKKNDKSKTRKDLSGKLLPHEKSDDYIYISLSKRSILFFLLIPFILLTIALSFNYLLTPELKQNFLGNTAVWLREKPLIKKYIPAKWLPKDYILNQVLPEKGYQTKLSFGNIGLKMVQAGVIDIQKLEEIYKNRGGIPKDMKKLLTEPSNMPILVTKENSAWLINILWPLGLSNRMLLNEQSPIAGENVGNYASTGGWTLGKEQNGGVYFNTLRLIELTPEQEKRVVAIAESIYRPCCNNSSFFQDCNHGSAALGLIELGVAQGLTDEEIYKTVLVFNSYWFPQNYTEMAFYFQHAKNKVWNDIDPKIILSKEYSSLSGWMNNIHTPAQNIPGLIPPTESGGGCSV